MRSKVIQVPKTVYISIDDKEFETAKECIKHEKLLSGDAKECPVCKGWGKVEKNNDYAGDGNWGSPCGVKHWTEECSNCKGKGYLVKKTIYGPDET